MSKDRLLALGLVPQGLRFSEDASGMRYLPFNRVPFELEDIVRRWFDALSPTHQAAIAHDAGEYYKGLTLEGWEMFVSWLKCVADAATWQPDFEATVAVSVQRHLDL